MAALELAEALFGEPGMTGLRGKIMLEAMMQIYGPAKLRTARLDAAEIAKRRGVAGSAVRRAIGEVVRFGLLERLGEGEYRIVKDYEKHDYGDGEAARERRLCAARNAVVLAKSYARRTPSPATQKTPADGTRGRNKSVTTDRSYRNENVTPSVTEMLRSRNDSVTPSVTEMLRSRNETVTPIVTELLRSDPAAYRNAGASEDLREIKKTSEDTHTPSAGAGERAGEGEAGIGQPQGPLAETPGNLRGRIIPMVRGADDILRAAAPAHPLDAPTRARLLAIAGAIRSPNMELAFQYGGILDSGLYPAGWHERVLTDALGWSTPPRSVRPLLNTLQGWAADGGPPPIPAPMAAASPGTPARAPYNPTIARAAERVAAAEAYKAKLRSEVADAID